MNKKIYVFERKHRRLSYLLFGYLTSGKNIPLDVNVTAKNHYAHFLDIWRYNFFVRRLWSILWVKWEI